MIFSGIEFYYTESNFISKNNLNIIGDESKHILKVMRHQINDEIFVTNGEGFVYKSVIKKIAFDKIECEIKEIYEQENIYKNLFFCIPTLKNPERMEFAIEKCVELGITNFCVFSADKSVKKNVNIERMNKIALSAMKQSLQSFKPKIKKLKSLSEIALLNNEIIVFEQNSEKSFNSFISNEWIKGVSQNKNYFFVFGPEGGLSLKDLNLISNPTKLSINKNRLRSETAIISVASNLCSL